MSILSPLEDLNWTGLMRVMARQPVFLSSALQVACRVKIHLQLIVLFVV